MTIKITNKQKALVEHYGYGVIAAGYATYQLNHHSIKEIVIGGLVGGLLVPALAKVNPKSLVNTIVKETGAPEEIVAPIVDTAVKKAKLIAEKKP